MKSAFIDTDVLLDTIMQRKPHYRASNAILALCEQNLIDGFTSSLVIANIYYIIKKLANHKDALTAIAKIRSIITILDFTDKEIGESSNAGFADFEDGVQYFIAVNNQLDCIITRNIKDFKLSNIAVLAPSNYLTLYNKS
jgi:predicted nucleic acid-binding protein